MGQEVQVPFGQYKDVLVIAETSASEPDAEQLKYFARGVGNVRVGWRGEGEKTQEVLELIDVQQLDPEALAEVRAKALALERSAYEISKDVYAHTSPAVAPDGSVATPPLPDTVQPAGSDPAQDGLPGTEEFGLSKRELVRKIEAVEEEIAKCMREHGFEYIAADYKTVRRGMSADKSLPGLSERQFIAQHGFGIATLYTGKAPQLAEGYSPGKTGLGEENVRIFKNLSAADQVAYNRALFGENTDATFAVAIENEDFSRCGGCTRTAIARVFDPDQLKASYYNPKDALINKDPRMKKALRQFAAEMREAGYDYDHPDDVEPDIKKRLYAITGGPAVPVEKLSPESQGALKELQAYERAVAKICFDLQTKIFEPVEEEIEEELYARPPK
jgi:hypothetical protein